VASRSGCPSRPRPAATPASGASESCAGHIDLGNQVQISSHFTEADRFQHRRRPRGGSCRDGDNGRHECSDMCHELVRYVTGGTSQVHVESQQALVPKRRNVTELHRFSHRTAMQCNSVGPMELQVDSQPADVDGQCRRVSTQDSGSKFGCGGQSASGDRRPDIDRPHPHTDGSRWAASRGSEAMANMDAVAGVESTIRGAACRQFRIHPGGSGTMAH
jgi:hypothetical protein